MYSILVMDDNGQLVPLSDSNYPIKRVSNNGVFDDSIIVSGVKYVNNIDGVYIINKSQLETVPTALVVNELSLIELYSNLKKAAEYSGYNLNEFFVNSSKPLKELLYSISLLLDSSVVNSDGSFEDVENITHVLSTLRFILRHFITQERLDQF